MQGLIDAADEHLFTSRDRKHQVSIDSNYSLKTEVKLNFNIINLSPVSKFVLFIIYFLNYTIETYVLQLLRN